MIIILFTCSQNFFLVSSHIRFSCIEKNDCTDLSHRCSACCSGKGSMSRERESRQVLLDGLSLPIPFALQETIKAVHTHFPWDGKYSLGKVFESVSDKVKWKKMKQTPCVFVCVWARASSVFGVSFCLALMKEFMFNSTAHPHICSCTLSPLPLYLSLSFPLSLYTQVSLLPSTLQLFFSPMSLSISLTKKKSFINHTKAPLTTDLS